MILKETQMQLTQSYFDEDITGCRQPSCDTRQNTIQSQDNSEFPLLPPREDIKRNPKNIGVKLYEKGLREK